MIKNYKHIFILIIFLCYSYLNASEYSGESSFQFLKMDIGARTLSMGGAFTGVADDVLSMRYNVAGLRMLVKPEISATYMSWIGGLRVNNVSFAMPYGYNKTFGLNIFYMSSIDNILGRDSAGNPTNNLNYSQMYVNFAGATKIEKYNDLLVGVGVKYAKEVLDYSDNSCLSFDVGLLTKIYREVNLGLSIRNVGIFARESLPIETRLGLSYLKNNIGYSFDLYKFNDTGVNSSFGIEWFLKDIFVARAGYNTALNSLGKLNEDEGLYDLSVYSISGISLGFGFITKPIEVIGGYSLKLDYAIVDYGRLGFTNILSLSMDF